MAEITDRTAPPDVPSSNALNDIEDPELDDDGTSIDRYLAFGTTPRAIVNPPKRGQVVTYQVKVECIGESWRERSDGEIRYSSDLNILSVARVGEQLPPDFVSKKEADRRAKEEAKASAKGKGLYDNPDEPTLPGTDLDGETPPAASGVDEPAFSDGKPTRGRGRSKTDEQIDAEMAAEAAAESAAEGE